MLNPLDYFSPYFIDLEEECDLVSAVSPVTQLAICPKKNSAGLEQLWPEASITLIIEPSLIKLLVLLSGPLWAGPVLWMRVRQSNVSSDPRVTHLSSDPSQFPGAPGEVHGSFGPIGRNMK